MKKKSLFAILLAACVAAGSMPAAVFAAGEGEADVTETDSLVGIGEPLQEPEENKTPSEPESEEGELPKEEALTGGTGALGEDPTSSPDPQETPSAGETGTPIPTPTEQPEEKQTVYIGDTAYDSLEAAVKAAGESASKAAEILLKGDQTIRSAVVIPAGVTVTLIGEKDVKLTKDDALAGSMFQVKGTLQLNKADSKTALSVVGKEKASAALFHVEGVLNANPGVSVSGNSSAGDGSAIYNTGTVQLNGAVIKDNKSDKGAVYNAGNLELSGTVQVTGNYKADGKTPSNVYLPEKAVVTAGKMDKGAKVGISPAKPSDGLAVAKAKEGVKLEEQTPYLSYDGGSEYAVGKEGKLEQQTPSEDITAPTLTEVSAERVAEDRAVVTFSSDEAGSYYYRVDDAQVDTSGKGNKMGENADVVQEVTGLTPGEHLVYIVGVDAAGNKSELLEIRIPAMAKEPMIADAKDNTINGIQSSYDRTYKPAGSSTTKYLVTFSATGAGMDYPAEEGNIRYEPKYWSIGGLKDQTFEEGYRASFSGTVDPGTYVLSVVFEQQRYNGENWEATGETDTKEADIVMNKTATPNPTAGAKKTTNSGTKTTKTGSGAGKTSAVDTADDSQVAPMAFLAFSAAALAGGLAYTKKKRNGEDE